MFSLDFLYQLLVASLVALICLIIGLIVHYRPIVDKELQNARNLMAEAKTALAMVKSIKNPLDHLFAPSPAKKDEDVLGDFLSLIPK